VRDATVAGGPADSHASAFDWAAALIDHSDLPAGARRERECDRYEAQDARLTYW